VKRASLLTTICLSVTCIVGCAKPDYILTIQSPTKGLFYTVETYHNHTPVADDTQVFVHLERNGKADKMLVLQGEDMTVARITWNGPYESTICIAGGFTSTFRNEVTLFVGSTSENIFVHLQEGCKWNPGNVTGYQDTVRLMLDTLS